MNSTHDKRENANICRQCAFRAIVLKGEKKSGKFFVCKWHPCFLFMTLPWYIPALSQRAKLYGAYTTESCCDREEDRDRAEGLGLWGCYF